MLHTVFLVIAVIVTFLGCAILFVDVIATKKTDCCQQETPAQYLGNGQEESEQTAKSGFFVLAAPEFCYTYKGKSYRGRSANVFFHLYLKKGKLPVPFLKGKTYYIYVNPAQPSMYVTSGEQRLAFMHLLGFFVSALGIVMLLNAMGFFS